MTAEARKPGDVPMGAGANTADLEALAELARIERAKAAAGGVCLGCGAKESDCPIVDGYCSDVCEEKHKAASE